MRNTTVVCFATDIDRLLKHAIRSPCKTSYEDPKSDPIIKNNQEGEVGLGGSAKQIQEHLISS